MLASGFCKFITLKKFFEKEWKTYAFHPLKAKLSINDVIVLVSIGPISTI